MRGKLEQYIEELSKEQDNLIDEFNRSNDPWLDGRADQIALVMERLRQILDSAHKE